MGIRYTHLTSLIASLLISGICSAQDYVADGKALGESQKQVMSGAVNATNATDSPFYNPNPAQASQFGSGTSLLNMGSQRISQCSGYSAGSDKSANQECEAVNFLANNPSTRRTYTIDKTDSIFTAARSAIESPPSSGPGITGSDSECVDRVVTQPDSFRKAFCDQWLTPEDRICTAETTVNVSSASMFTCTDTLLQTTTEQCSSVIYSDYRVDAYRSSTKVATTCGGDSTIQSWYNNYAGRCADVEGMNYWTNQKNTPTAVYTYGATKVAMTCGGDPTIQSWYNNYAGRCADTSGLNWWVSQLPNFQNSYSKMFPSWYSGLQAGYPGGVTKDQYFCHSGGTLVGTQCRYTTYKYPTYSELFPHWYNGFTAGYPGGVTKDQWLCNTGGRYVYLTTQCEYQSITMIPTYQCTSLASQTSTGSSLTYPVLVPSTCGGDPTIQSWYHQYDSRCADTAGMTYWSEQLTTNFGGNYSRLFDAWYTGFLGNGGRGSFWPSLCNQGDEYILDSTNCRRRVYSTGSNCQQQGSTCVDSTPVKYFNGIAVNVSSVGGCWQYRDTYQCLRPLGTSTCNAVASTPSCQQINQTCTTPAFNGSCAQQTRTFRCGDANLPTPTGSTSLGQTPTITSSTSANSSQCEAYDQNAECTQYEDICVEPNQTKVINGISVFQECWKWHRKYNCYSTDYTNDCQNLINRSCINQNRDVCLENTAAGRCALYQREYSCRDQEGVQSTVQDCGLRTFCSTDASGNQQCWDTSHQNDEDFLKAVVGMEAGREAGQYIDGSMKLFTGKPSHCSKGILGVKDCCEESGGARSNNTVMSTVGTQAIKAVGQAAVNVGSKYMYDFMYPDMPWGQLAGEALTDFSPSITPTSFTPSVGAYGFTLSAGAAPQGAIVLAEGIGGTSMTFAFDPMSFAIAIAIQVVMAVTTCNPDEINFSMQKGAGLCHNVGLYCSKRFLGKCMEKKESYCCFNSKLARILQEQGRAQIGKGWGGGANPDCSGFSIEEFERIDFSQIDLSEFVNDIMENIDIPDVDYIQTYMREKMAN